jgi:transcriptional regulator GlxA family with amidase domain
MPRHVALLIFDEVEVLDFAGPFEVFSVAGYATQSEPFVVYTVAETSVVYARNRLCIQPHYLLTDAPKPDILLIPGGFGVRQQLHNSVVMNWIADLAPQVELLLSVCTGSWLLAKLGLLDGLGATTHHSGLARLQALAPQVTVYPERRFVDNGRIITSAGITAGMDMALHVVAKLLGETAAQQTARYMEYSVTSSSQE